MTAYKPVFRSSVTSCRDDDGEEMTSFLTPLALILVVVFTLIGIIPMAMTTKDWSAGGADGARQCMLYASLTQYQRIGDTWGSSAGTCWFVALGAVPGALCGGLLLLVYWQCRGRRGTDSRLWRGFTLAALLVALLHLCVTCALTDGYTRTCLAVLGSNANMDRHQYRSCSDGLDSRDTSYSHSHPTRQLLALTLAGYWAAMIAWVAVVWSMIVNMLNSKRLYCLS